MAVSTGLVALGVSALGLGSSLSSAKRAKKHDKKANKAQIAINKLKNAQVKRNFLRSFRQAQANNLSTAVASGVDVESSRTQGALSSERTQRDVGLQEFAEFDRLGGVVTNQQQRGADARFDSQVAGQVANFASQFISFGND